MIAYLTIGDQPSGIYYSQVIDVCTYLSKTTSKNIRLIALISLRGFFKNRKKIKSLYSDAVIIPMVPQLKHWRYNIICILFILMIFRVKVIICRNSIPSVLALKIKKIGLIKKVIYDARGLEYEQIKEYGIIKNVRLANDILLSEKRAVLFSDFQLSISNKLLQYWKDNYDYEKTTNVVIPCSLNMNMITPINVGFRKEMGFEMDDIIIAYAGSSAGWQSFNLMMNFFTVQLQSNNKIKVLLLTKTNPEIMQLEEKFRRSVICKWCKEEEVHPILLSADYGVLIREDSMTNRVSSPVKFAEYLAAGLDVIISENIGDYSEFVVKNNCGLIYKGNKIELKKRNNESRIKNYNLALKYFSKGSDEIQNRYKKLLEAISVEC